VNVTVICLPLKLTLPLLLLNRAVLCFALKNAPITSGVWTGAALGLRLGDSLDEAEGLTEIDSDALVLLLSLAEGDSDKLSDELDEGDSDALALTDCDAEGERLRDPLLDGD